MCELCSPFNKVVRRYPEPRLYLLSLFRGEQEMSPPAVDEYWAWLVPNRMPFFRPARHYFKSIDEIIAFLNEKSSSDPTFEGVVICDKNGLRYKVKNPTYLALHRLKGEGDNLFHPRHLLPFALAGNTDELLTYFPEAREELEKVQGKLIAAWDNLSSAHQDSLGIASQKDFALAITQRTEFSSLLFGLRKQHGENIPPEELRKTWLASGDLIVRRLFGG